MYLWSARLELTVVLVIPEMKPFTIIILLYGALLSSPLCGQLSINSAGTDYTIDFNGYDGSALSPTSPGINSNSWAITGLSLGSVDFGNTGAAGSFRGTAVGAVSDAGIYAFQPNGSNALGVQPNLSTFFFGIIRIETFIPGDLTLRMQNNTGSEITALDIGYDIFEYNDTDFSNSFNFSHSSDNLSYTLVGSLDHASVEAAAGLPGWVETGKNTNLTGLSIADGDYYYLRWSSADISGTGVGQRDQFALDNVVVNAEVIPEPSTYALLLGGFILGFVILRRRYQSSKS